MTIDVQFTEISEEITTDFGEIFEASDGGYDKGYNEGYDKGVETGYTDGYNKGVETGYNTGFAEGETKGYENGYNEGETVGYNKGQTEGVDAFRTVIWNGIQQSGARTDYNYAFRLWRNMGEIWKPIHDIKPTTASYMFYNAQGISNLPELCKELGITIDFANSTGMTQFGAYSSITHLGTVDVRKVTSGLTSGLANMTALVQVHLIIKDDGSQNINGCFSGCSQLAELTIEGGIKTTTSFGACPLNKASIENVFDVLLGSASGQTVTFKKTAVNVAFETSEGANDGSTSDEWNSLVASKPSWTVSLS